MLEDNRSRVQNLTGLEIWLFIIGRVLVGFGLGVVSVLYLPQVFAKVGFPAIILGLVVLIAASRGLLRKRD